MLEALKARCKVRVWGNNPYLVLSVQFAFRLSRPFSPFSSRPLFPFLFFLVQPLRRVCTVPCRSFHIRLTNIYNNALNDLSRITADSPASLQYTGTSCGLRLTARDHIPLVSGVLQTGVKTLQGDSLPHSKQNILLKSYPNCPTCQQKMLTMRLSRLPRHLPLPCIVTPRTIK